MIIVTGIFPINPKKRAEAVAALNIAVAATEQEAGCITYRFYEDIDAPCRFHVYEEWESAEHLAAHGKSAHIAELRAAMPNILAGAPTLSRYEATELT